MPRFPRERSLWLIGLLLCALPLLASCAPDANAQILSPELEDRMIALEAGNPAFAAPTPPPPLIALSPEEQIAGLADEAPEVAQLISSGAADSANGEVLAASQGCVGCHLLDPEAAASGPTWYNLGNKAVGRVSDQSPALYLYHSIAAPNDYLVRGYQEGIMVQTYRDSLSDQDFADLITYIMEQQQEMPEDFDPNAVAADGEITGTETLTDAGTMTGTVSEPSGEGDAEGASEGAAADAEAEPASEELPTTGD